MREGCGNEVKSIRMLRCQVIRQWEHSQLRWGKTCVGWSSWRSFCRRRRVWGAGWHVSRKARGGGDGGMSVVGQGGGAFSLGGGEGPLMQTHGGREYDTGGVWVVTQVVEVKLSFLSWSLTRRVGGYQDHPVPQGSSGLASG